MDCRADESHFNQPLAAFRRKRLELAEAPEFTQRLTSFLEVEVGKSATFIGQFKAVPEGKVKWFKDEEQLCEDSKHVFECVKQTGLVKLIILHLNRKDEGAYRCRVENQEGVATTTGYLSVIASKNRGKKSSKRKCNMERVSSPPLLNPIVEQRSVEEIEEKEYRTMPPSPLHEFLSSIRHSAKSMKNPIYYGTLENFNDILDVENLTDEDEEVFEANRKGQRSSDEDDLSTGESSSSEAEIVRTPTDQNLPQMLGLARPCDQQISKFTPVRVYTAGKRRQHSTTHTNDNTSDNASTPANRPTSLPVPSSHVQITTSSRCRSKVPHHVSKNVCSEPTSVSNATLENAGNRETGDRFVNNHVIYKVPLTRNDANLEEEDERRRDVSPTPNQPIFSSHARPLLFSPVHLQQRSDPRDGSFISKTTSTDIKVPGGNQSTDLLPRGNNYEPFENAWMLISVILVATFLSIFLSISPRDVVLVVGATSALLFVGVGQAKRSQ